MSLNPAPSRQTQREYPTPRIADVLFSELYDTTREEIPPYGTPHPDTKRWPKHKLCFVREAQPGENERKRDGLFIFVYVAERENQDDYNWEFGSTSIGGIMVDTVIRSYITPRESFTPSNVAIGSSMPDVPAGKFPGDWRLHDIDQRRIGERERGGRERAGERDLDSLFVVEQHTYIKDTAVQGESYGKIVTEDVKTQVLVPEGTPTDTGIQIISSEVSPTGNGMAVKQTREVKGGTWPDPVESTAARTRENLIPQKFRSFVTRFMQSRKVSSVPTSITLAGNEVGKEYARETPDRVDEKVTTETIDESTSDLEGKVVISTYGGGVADTFERLVDEGAEPESGFEVISSSVNPLGNGKAIKESVIMPETDAYPILVGKKYNTELGIDFPFEEEVIPAGEMPADSDVDPIDKWRSKRRTPDLDAIQTALDGIFISYPTQQSVQLPNVLKSAKIHVVRSRANGNSFQVGPSSSVRNDSSVSVSADLRWEIEEGFNGPVPAEVVVFFLPIGGTTASTIATKAGAAAWPVYRPKSHRLVILGHGENKRFSASKSSGGYSGSESSGVQALSSVAVIPACIHEAITIDVEYLDFDAPTTVIDQAIDTATEQWGTILAQIRADLAAGFYRGYPVTPEQAAIISARLEVQEDLQQYFTDLDVNDFPVTVYPNTLDATTPSSLVAGKYVWRSSVELYGYEMVRVTAVVVDLTTIIT